MTEKYKIYIPEDIKSRLANDAELFEFTKSDGSVNLNAFLKELLINYFEPYRERKEKLLNTILSDLSELSSISKTDADVLADRIINTYLRDDNSFSKSNAVITLTVSGRSLEIINTIENNLLTDISLSQYLKDMFISYLSISRGNRERIIFKETYEELTEAISKRRTITFSSTSSSGNGVFTMNPYLIATSKEEQYNYLLCYDPAAKHARTFRMSRLTSLYSTSNHFEIDEKVMEELKEVALRNPQSASMNEMAKIRFTEKGKQKFKVIVKNRPDVYKKDGDVYYFNWPIRQLEEYFKRFGKDAVVLEPAKLRESMKIFYRKALDVYKKPVE
ncbi:MAG: WYL domain-containing protein [Lachnospiraceae bacterium]|nr:WYL domain-containing protein [Lachnospiraceae bacterium]